MLKIQGSSDLSAGQAIWFLTIVVILWTIVSIPAILREIRRYRENRRRK